MVRPLRGFYTVFWTIYQSLLSTHYVLGAVLCPGMAVSTRQRPALPGTWSLALLPCTGVDGGFTDPGFSCLHPRR